MYGPRWAGTYVVEAASETKRKKWPLGGRQRGGWERSWEEAGSRPGWSEVGPGKKGSQGWVTAWLVLHHDFGEPSEEVFNSFQSTSIFTYWIWRNAMNDRNLLKISKAKVVEVDWLSRTANRTGWRRENREAARVSGGASQWWSPHAENERTIGKIVGLGHT